MNSMNVIKENLTTLVDSLCGLRNYAEQCCIADDTLHGVCEGLPFVPDDFKQYMDPETLVRLTRWEPYKLVCSMKRVYEMLIAYHVDTATIKKVMKQMMDHNRIIDPYYLTYIDDDSAPGFSFLQFFSRPERYIDTYNNAHPGQHQVVVNEVEDGTLNTFGMANKKHVMTIEDYNLIWQWIFSLQNTDSSPYVNYQYNIKLEIVNQGQATGEDILHRVLGE